MIARSTSVALLLFSLAVVAVAASGCGKSGPNVKTAGVSGSVSLDGKPLEGVTVVFVGEGGKFIGMGKTGLGGKYRLDSGSIPGKQGAMVGTNQVYFTKALDNMPQEPPMIPPDHVVIAEPKDSSIPAQYSDPVKPALSFDVPERGTESADFQLTSR